MPQIQFSYLICSYLPGIPLALVLWNVPWLKNQFDSVLKENNNVGIGFMIIIPLFAGLFVDGFRHFVEKITYKPGKFDLWPMVSKGDLIFLKNTYGETGSMFIFNKISTHYSMYEFFANLGFACLFASILRLFVCDKTDCRITAFLILLMIISLLFAWLFRGMRQKTIQRYGPLPNDSQQPRSTRASETPEADRGDPR